MLRVNYRRTGMGRVESVEPRTWGGSRELNRNTAKKKVTSAKSVFQRKIGKRARVPSPLLAPAAAHHHGAPRACIAHASAFVDNTAAANVVNCSELAKQAFLHTHIHTHPRHGQESLSTRQFSERFCGSGGRNNPGCFNTRFAQPGGTRFFPR